VSFTVPSGFDSKFSTARSSDAVATSTCSAHGTSRSADAVGRTPSGVRS
jgi:hypothetical protein